MIVYGLWAEVDHHWFIPFEIELWIFKISVYTKNKYLKSLVTGLQLKCTPVNKDSLCAKTSVTMHSSSKIKEFTYIQGKMLRNSCMAQLHVACWLQCRYITSLGKRVLWIGAISLHQLWGWCILVMCGLDRYNSETSMICSLFPLSNRGAKLPKWFSCCWFPTGSRNTAFLNLSNYRWSWRIWSWTTHVYVKISLEL